MDTGFILALYGHNDQHSLARRVCVLSEVSRSRGVVPWPVLYEAVKRPLTVNPRAIEQLDRDWAALELHGRLELVDGTPWRQGAFTAARGWRGAPARNARAVSLVDLVLCAAIEDQGSRIGIVVSTDPTDLWPSCRRAGIHLEVI